MDAPAISVPLRATAAQLVIALSVVAAGVPAGLALALVVGISVLTAVVLRLRRAAPAHAVLDPLTGTLDPAALAYRADELAQQSALTGEAVGVVVGDLDRFRLVNDVIGHAEGDEVLREVARVLRANLRAFDLVYRMGGEEFLVLLPGAALPAAQEVAERLRAAVAAARPAGLELSMSLGVSAAAGPAVRFDELFRRAEGALHQAKTAGRNRVELAPPVSAVA